MTSSAARKITATCAFLGLAAFGTAVTSTEANAQYVNYGYGYRYYAPPVVVAPPASYYPPTTYYAPPQRVWIPAHWRNGYWVPGHWS